MTTRKAEDFLDGEDQPPTKCQQIRENSSASLESMNDDCLLTILSYFSVEDLNSVAICGRRYRRLRAHESLDQTRSGTIIVTEGCTLPSLANTIVANNWNQTFQGNRSHLKIVGLERLPIERAGPYHIDGAAHVQMHGVTNLDMNMSFSGPLRPHHHRNLCSFPHMFPNLTTIDLSSVTMADSEAVNFNSHLFREKSLRVADYTWNGSRGRRIALDGFSFRRAFHLSRLCLDNCCFHLTDQKLILCSDTTNNVGGTYAFHHCHHLERLSIKNATIQDFSALSDNVTSTVPQEMLIKMVRCHPTLTWLRSDLSPENVAMLQEERPDMTFVGE